MFELFLAFIFAGELLAAIFDCYAAANEDE